MFVPFYFHVYTHTHWVILGYHKNCWQSREFLVFICAPDENKRIIIYGGECFPHKNMLKWYEKNNFENEQDCVWVCVGIWNNYFKKFFGS